MKRTKKFASLLLALVVALSMSMTAFATGSGETPESSGSGGGTTESEATETGKITIDNAVVGQTYTIYEILKLESYDKDKGAYSYKATEAWSTFINSDGIKGTYVNVDTSGYVTWKQGADAAAFAKAALAYAKDTSHSISATDTKTAASTTTGQTVTTVVFGEGDKKLELGYYLLDSSLGTLCSLDTTNPEVTIKEKNEQPTSDKKVEEDSDPGKIDKDRNDADIGQLVNFQSTITAKENVENFVFHDEMSAGLTFGDVQSITLNGEAVNENSYQVIRKASEPEGETTGQSEENTGGSERNTCGCTFEVIFTQNFCDTLKKDDKIVISYTATVNENAIIGGDGNTNTCRLGYGDPGHTSYTADSTTKTYTWKVDAFKYTEEGEGENKTEVPLAGVKFTLSKSNDGSSPIALIKVSEENTAANSQAGAVYRVAKIISGTAEIGSVTDITTGATGKFTIQGLDSDTYYLTETEAPAGYNKAVVQVVIDKDGNIKTKNAGESGDLQSVSEVKILNQTGPELPSTGGMGTRIFYVVGGILVLGAVVLLIAKRRMNAEK